MDLTGVLAPIPTPFDPSDRADLKRFRRALTRWLQHPLTGFVVLGTSGEAPLLDDSEADRVTVAARDAVPLDRTLIIGTGRESTRAAVRAAKRAAALGADAVLVRTPGVFRHHVTSEGILAHYTAIADASPVPVLLYNFPALTGVSLDAPTVARLARHANIIGMKDSSGDVLQLSDFAAGASDASFSVLSGSGSTFHTAISMGASGGILALACVVPNACVSLYELAVAQQHADARALQQQLLPLAKLVGSVHGVPGLKAALNILGYDVGAPRLPLLPASQEAEFELRAALSAFADPTRSDLSSSQIADASPASDSTE